MKKQIRYVTFDDRTHESPEQGRFHLNAIIDRDIDIVARHLLSMIKPFLESRVASTDEEVEDVLRTALMNCLGRLENIGRALSDIQEEH